MAFDGSEILITVLQNFMNLVPVRKIHSYEQGVKFSFGRDVKWIREPGINLYMPFFQSIAIVNTRYEGVDLCNCSIESSDGIPLTLSGNVVYRIANARKCLTKIGDTHARYEDSVRSFVEKYSRGLLSRIAKNYDYRTIKSIEEQDKSEIKEEIVEELVVVNLNSTGNGKGNGSNNQLTYNLSRDVFEHDHDLDDECDEVPKELPVKYGNSKLERKVTDTLNQQFRRPWGIEIYDFWITDCLKTGLMEGVVRLYGDTSTT